MILVDFLEYILEFFYSFSNNYGISIVLVSFSVMLILLPFNWISEKIIFFHKIKMKKIQAELNEFKNLKNKKEKYYYTKEIYKKNNYKSYYSLISLSGLVIQIPFFLAIYVLLIDYPLINEVSFGLIKDLSKADELIRFNSFSINLLPFVMTLVNVIATFFSNKNINKKEKIQLLVVSIVFFFLLYDLASALLLYWTMNNVFSILKDWMLLSIKGTKIDASFTKFFTFIKVSSNKFYSRYWFYILLLLFSIIPLLAVYSINIDQLYGNKTPVYILLNIILVITILLCFFVNWFFKDQQKTYVFVFVILFLFFSFGHVNEFIWRYFSIQQRYSLPIVFVIFSLVFLTILFKIVKVNKTSDLICKRINLFIISISSLVLIKIALYNPDTTLKHLDNISSNKDSYSSTVLANINDVYPDIYYIVLDAYSNSKILSKEFNFNNENIEKFLSDKGFFIAKEATSNYSSTFHSLASILNMTYLNHLSDSITIDFKNRNTLYKMISDNKVSKFLKKKGYQTIHFGSTYGPTIKNYYSDYNFSSELFDQFTADFLNTTALSPLVAITYRGKYKKNILYTFENLPKLEEIKKPKFVFAHIMSPHPPYLFKENGDTVDNASFLVNNYWNKKELNSYLGQIKFINKKIKILVDDIMNNNSNSVIILQSDHGPSFLSDKEENGKPNWSNPANDFLRERHKIFNAIYISSNFKNSLYDSISSVNTFRSVFNSVFQENFKILNDSTFLSSYEKPYKFINITNKLRN